MKTCKRCGESKPLAEFSTFYCKSCNAAKIRKWREANPERSREIGREYRERHKERLREESKSADNREKRNSQARARRAKQTKKRPLYRPLLSPEMKRERRRVRDRERYYASHEAVLAKRKAYRAANPEVGAKAAEVARSWREQNPERFKASRDRWRRENWDKVLDSNARRRAQIRTTEVERFSRSQIYDRDGGRCHICGKSVAREDFVIDHLVPLSKGGTHTRDNVRVAHDSCNLRRSDGRIPAQLLLVG